MAGSEDDSLDKCATEISGVCSTALKIALNAHPVNLYVVPDGKSEREMGYIINSSYIW